MSIDAADLIQIGTGLYVDAVGINELYLHIGDILKSRSLEDTQEARAAIYGVMYQFCKAQCVDLILIAEPGVPSIESYYHECNP
ncbi:MAG: hypothetical protein ACE5OQ_14930 [Woeseia sp.]